MRRIILWLFPLFVMLGLAGCGGPNPTLISKEYKIYIPPDEFFHCNVLDTVPNPETLTDGQVAELLLQLDENNRDCQKSIRAIRENLEQAKKRVEKK